MNDFRNNSHRNLFYEWGPLFLNLMNVCFRTRFIIKQNGMTVFKQVSPICRWLVLPLNSNHWMSQKSTHWAVQANWSILWKSHSFSLFQRFKMTLNFKLTLHKLEEHMNITHSSLKYKIIDILPTIKKHMQIYSTFTSIYYGKLLCVCEIWSPQHAVHTTVLFFCSHTHKHTHK